MTSPTLLLIFLSKIYHVDPLALDHRDYQDQQNNYNKYQGHEYWYKYIIRAARFCFNNLVDYTDALMMHCAAGRGCIKNFTTLHSFTLLSGSLLFLFPINFFTISPQSAPFHPSLLDPKRAAFKDCSQNTLLMVAQLSPQGSKHCSGSLCFTKYTTI